MTKSDQGAQQGWKVYFAGNNVLEAAVVSAGDGGNERLGPSFCVELCPSSPA